MDRYTDWEVKKVFGFKKDKASCSHTPHLQIQVLMTPVAMEPLRHGITPGHSLSWCDWPVTKTGPAGHQILHGDECF